MDIEFYIDKQGEHRWRAVQRGSSGEGADEIFADSGEGTTERLKREFRG